MSETVISQEKQPPGKKVSELLAERQKKRRKKKLIIGGVVAFLLLIVWIGLQPLTAGSNFGVCRTYLETYTKYPRTLKITQYDEYGRSLRIFFTYVDAFGGTRSEMLECIVSPDSSRSITMQDIKLNRKSISSEELVRFNMAIPGILASNPSRVIPPPSRGDLRSLKYD